MADTQSDELNVYEPMRTPPRYRLEASAGFGWLREGWGYLKKSPIVSLIYGGIFAAIGFVITLLGIREPQFVFTFWSGFLLVGPLLAMGFYRVAQLRDDNERVRLTSGWPMLRKRLGSIALFSLLLSVVMIAWIRFSTLIAALYVGNITGSESLLSALLSPEGLGFLAVQFGVGAVFAAIMFALTAWSLPLVLDNRIDFGTAIVTSVKATVEQPVPMLVWGVLVAILAIIGMLTFFVAFSVIFPLLGYATWAGYKELFNRD